MIGRKTAQAFAHALSSRLPVAGLVGTSGRGLSLGTAAGETADSPAAPATPATPAHHLAPFSRALVHLAHGLRVGHLTVELPDGSRRSVAAPGFDDTAPAGGSASLRAVLCLHSDAAARAVFTRGGLGFGEAYVDGLWDSPDLVSLLRLAAANEPHLMSGVGLWPVMALSRLKHLRRANTKKGARRNIAYHYDLGNAFYRQWLDPSMTYSSALFARDGGAGAETAAGLAAAQRAKVRRVARLLDLKPGMTVLEIGCGWGGFAEIAAREFGARVVGLTLSQEQLAYARERIAAAGLADRVDLRLQDYRDVTESFDRIASIEMFEAVGEDNWPIYFRTLRDRLVPGGRAVLQVISIDESRFAGYRATPDFIQTHVFPGGMLPTPSLMTTHLGAVGLTGGVVQRFGLSYAATLALWRDAFETAWPRIADETGFDERFRRLWTYYLAYCEAGFREGAIDVGFYVGDKPAASVSAAPVSAGAAVPARGAI